MKNLFLLLILGILSLSSWGQKDTEFWFAAPEVSQNDSSYLDREIVLRVTTYTASSYVIVSQPAGGGMPPQIMTVPANSTYTFNLTSWIDVIETKPADQVKDFGLKVTATQPISVYYEVVSGGTGPQPPNNPEAFVLKGSNALGTEFYIPSQNILPNDYYSPPPRSSFDIIATEDNTTVTILPSKDLVGHFQSNGAYNISLDEGQVYSATAYSRLAAQHLQGSKVTSNKPIAITIKDDLLDGWFFGGGCADLAGDQIIPVDLIGTEYIAIKGLLDSPGDYLFVTATQNNTKVYKDGNSTPIATLNAGQTHSFPIVGNSTYIQTSAPAYTWQLSGSGCEVGATVLPAVGCSGSDQVSYVRSSANQLYMNLLVPSGYQNFFQVNNSSISGTLFTSVPGTGGAWRIARILLPLSQYPQGGVISVSNTSAKFHMSMVDINGGGTSYAYFSDYGSISATASVSPNPICIGDNIQLFSNAVSGATYSWNGPNGFNSSLQNPVISNASFSNTGVYTVEIDQAGCKASSLVNVSVIACPKECIIEIGYCFNFNNPYTYNFWANGNPPGGIYIWDFGDGSPQVQTTSAWTSHTYPGPGSYTLSLIYITPDKQECFKKVNICVAENEERLLKEDGQTNILKSDSDNESPFGELYPNPAYTEINIPIDAGKLQDKDGMMTAIIYNIEGKKLLEKSLPGSTVQTLISLPVDQLPDGSYFCELYYGDTREVRKFVKYTPNSH